MPFFISEPQSLTTCEGQPQRPKSESRYGFDKFTIPGLTHIQANDFDLFERQGFSLT